ncbi:transposase [Nesterenkonia sphaerica]|uniref:Transposase n=1 Tax=Nesterenkonia sphaerica TaxID=1804988 RepID=A0A5R9AL38_9MICC|nr:transposase [Nesterenkonia sphaerica]
MKEHLRRVVAATDIPPAQNARIDFEMAVAAADMVETDKLAATVAKWWTEIKVFVRAPVTNARTEAANTGIKQIKHTGRGFRNQRSYQSRILGTRMRQTRRRRRIHHHHQGFHAQR